MNKLAKETSPYLLQHAHNPVDWFPWGEEALEMARTENKPILVSIGYSACHWCHVMERECFEKESVAAVMNEHLVCIKVDREERPDIDAIYMDAVHLMGVRGGWPLNVFLLPDAKPFYGVTYLPPQNWVQLVKSIRNAFENHHTELVESAEGFAASLQTGEAEKYGLSVTSTHVSVNDLDAMFEKLKRNFDTEKGGMDRAPKFPMPSIYKFLLRYYDLTQNPEALVQVELTLNRMAMGGIYDHVGGGWARYSVDDEWFIPHFEKMLYDNAQLISLYSETYSLTQNPLYAARIRHTYDWLMSEMRSAEGGFFSALDADSEGVEGKFYVWTADELRAVLGENYSWFATLYGITDHGNWEHGLNHLHLTQDVQRAAISKGIFDESFLVNYETALQTLARHRTPRVRPGLDDKILASWNGLLLKGLTDAYRALGDEEIRTTAIELGHFLKEKMVENSQLWHSYKEGKASVNGFLEDYAAVSEGLLGLYQITFDEYWLSLVQELLDYSLDHFYDPEDGFFFFTHKEAENLIARKKELFDNVIPGSNSILAHALFQAGSLLDHPTYIELADGMLNRMDKILKGEIQVATNWAAFYAQRVQSTAEIVIVGPEFDEFRKDLDRFFIPTKLMAGGPDTSDLPLLAGRTAINGQTAIYVCYDKTCQLPVLTVEEALKLIQ
ncbi:thioredoxin domain-containing protein [Arundinibacter roseus]|uniref:Thioredoxin domain-containing protein n=1 Tax=Arundinibacter roseus TaxID=2070510 RepID=A0A4R4KA65_9BACT|nr:thioredoxin domain-containing protein [Arundinibacter roseus]TDB64443.1 thioredoxin domain-containing protein [Arundinibacter roseus]